ncbi:MAG: hypothetical protein LBQ98_04495 [Nitrososphaerota archaeon]|jgi:hypothetical protein|nr:hypothetical protein [Nitrososphaerota archaeon]
MTLHTDDSYEMPKMRKHNCVKADTTIADNAANVKSANAKSANTNLPKPQPNVTKCAFALYLYPFPKHVSMCWA